MGWWAGLSQPNAAVTMKAGNCHGQPFLSSCVLASLTNSGHCFLGCPTSCSFSPSRLGGQTHFPVPPKGHSERANELGSSNNPRQGVRDLPPLNTHGKQIAWHHLHSPHQIYSKSKHPFPSSWFSFNCAEHNPNLPQERWSVCIFLFLLFYK